MSGKKIIKLSSNETPLGPSPKAIEAYGNAAKRLHRYPDGSAASLRQAIGDVYGLNPEHIVCGAGSDELISLLCLAYAGPGDEVLYSQYGFLMYDISARAVGASPVTAPEKDYHTDCAALLAAVTDRTKIIFIANPNNPTGTFIPVSEIAAFAKELPDHILLVLDGAYAEYMDNPDYSDGAELIANHPNVIVTHTFSKIYGLGSVRCGWAYGSEAVIDVLNRVRGPFNVSTAALESAEAAVKDTDFTAHAKNHNSIWLAWLTKALGDMGFTTTPSAANFILLQCASVDEADACNAALENAGIIVRRMHAYDMPEALRITIGLEEDNKAIIKALESVKPSV